MILHRTWLLCTKYKTFLIDQCCIANHAPGSSADCRSHRRVDCFAVTFSKVGVSWWLSAGELCIDIFFELLLSVPGFLLQVFRTVGGWEACVILLSTTWIWAGLGSLWLPLSGIESLFLVEFPAVNQFNKHMMESYIWVYSAFSNSGSQKQYCVTHEH